MHKWDQAEREITTKEKIFKYSMTSIIWSQGEEIQQTLSKQSTTFKDEIQTANKRKIVTHTNSPLTCSFTQ